MYVKVSVQPPYFTFPVGKVLFKSNTSGDIFVESPSGYGDYFAPDEICEISTEEYERLLAQASKRLDVKVAEADLTPTQCEALEYALYLSKHRTEADRWFYAQFTTRGSIEFFCRPQTLEALYRRGRLDRRMTYYGDGTTFKEYRYTESQEKSND